MARSLYQCFQAKVKGDRLVCASGHSIGSKDGSLPIVKLQRGDALELSACRDCPDYNEMGPSLPPEERGWVSQLGK